MTGVPPSSAAPGPQFLTTRWSVIAQAAAPLQPQQQMALQELCAAYWMPVYAFIRRSGMEAHQAEDSTQDFFLDLVNNRRLLETADQAHGRFRSYLLAAVKHHLAHWRRGQRAQKRGGGRHLLPLDFADAERCYAAEPSDGWTAEALFHRRWALTLLDRVLQQLAERHAAAGRGAWFEALQPYLTAGDDCPPQDDVAQRLGTTPAAVRVAIHRLRRQYRDALTAEIAATLGDETAVIDERTELFRALSGEV